MHDIMYATKLISPLLLCRISRQLMSGGLWSLYRKIANFLKLF